jgi:hypothetical protein
VQTEPLRRATLGILNEARKLKPPIDEGMMHQMYGQFIALNQTNCDSGARPKSKRTSSDSIKMLLIAF